MGGASLGCPLAEEAEAEEAEEEGMVPFQQPFQVLSLGASAGQREAVPERVCAGEGCSSPALVVGGVIGIPRQGKGDCCLFFPRPQLWPSLCTAGGLQAQMRHLEGPGSALLVVPRSVSCGLPSVCSPPPQP